MSDQDAKNKEKEENRRNFPETAKILDHFRAVFGHGVKLMWASENGKEIGKRGSE